MVIHEAPGVAEPTEPLDNKPAQIEEVFSIFVSPEYPAPGIASCSHMVEGARIFYPEWTCHIARLSNQFLHFKTPYHPCGPA